MSLIEALLTHDFTHVHTALTAEESPDTIDTKFISRIHAFGYGSTRITGYRSEWITPLIYAIDHRLEDIALLLLDYGAEPNPVGVSIHPLNLACKHGLERVVERLLERNAHANLTDRLHRMPILEAIKAPILAREPETGELTAASIETTKNIITHLINAGVRLNPEDNTTFDADTPIYQAATGSSWSRKQMVDLLMDLGATINLQDNDGITFLEYLADSELSLPSSLSEMPVTMRSFGSMGSEVYPEYIARDRDHGSRLITYILGRLLRNQQYQEIRQLVNAVKEAEENAVTDERRQALSIVNGCLLCAKRVLNRVGLLHGGVDQENPLSHANILSFLNFSEQHLFTARDFGESRLTSAPASETAMDEEHSESTLTPRQSICSLGSLSTDLGDFFDETSQETHFTAASEEMQTTSTIQINMRDEFEEEPTILGKRKYLQI